MKDIWLSSYPAGVVHEIDVDSYPTLVEMCAQAWALFPHNKAFGNFSSYLSFAEVDRLSSAFAAYLQQHTNLQPGDRVAIMMPNLLQYPVAIFGILRAGLVVVNTNPQYTPRELRHQLVDSGAKCIVVFKNVLKTVHEVAPATALETVVTTELGDLFSFPKSMIFSRIARRGQKTFSATFDIEVVNFNAALKRGAKSVFKPPVIKSNDLAFLQYTGGTTGISKAAILSHQNLVANTLQVAAWFSG